jgi:Protein of unknown function with PCYCGC motif
MNATTMRIALTTIACAILAFAQNNQTSAAVKDTPPYHNEVGSATLPPTLDPTLFASKPIACKSYRAASHMRALLYQLPCYCECDRYRHHRSLLACFATRHGSECNLCQKELVYALRQSRKGVPIDQIREGIIEGQWKEVDLLRLNDM